MLFEAFKKMREERPFSAAFLVTSGDLALPIAWKQFTDDIDIVVHLIRTYAKVKEILGADADKTLVAVSDYTGQPEMQGGLVKTLDFKIYLGLLSEKYNDAHQQDLKRLSAQPIDMVVVNLYPFRETVAKAGVTPEMARTNIDIGGPCMVRASAKNYLRVASVTDPLDYGNIATELADHDGTLGLDTRFKLMKKAFTHTAEYDTAISKFFTTRTWEEVDKTYNQH